MIAVSDDFKKAIKENDRRLFGYVDIKYQNTDTSLTVLQQPQNLNIFNSDGIISNKKTMDKYATLENNYTILDGSFRVWNENILLDGYASNDTFENIEDTSIIIDNINFETKSNGVTIYFKENLPLEFTVTFTDDNENRFTDNITNNQSYVYQYIFENEETIIEIELNVLRVEFPQNRLRIASIDFNVGDLYEGEELISFDVMEELDLLMETMPVNTCSVKLNNYPDSHGSSKFDIINPKGIVKYLTDDTTLEPYIGVLTEEKGIEYVKMGTFYLKDWSSNSDGNITMNGVSNIGKLSNIPMASDGNFLGEIFSGSGLSEKITSLTGLDFDIPLPISDDGRSFSAVSNLYLKKTNWIGYLQAVYSNRLLTDFDDEPVYMYKFYDSRDNITKFSKLSDVPVDNISQNELISDVDFQTNSNINVLEISDKDPNETLWSNTREDILVARHTLSNTEEYIWFDLEKLTDDSRSTFTYTVVSGSGSAEIIDKNCWLLYVKFTGTIGTVFNVVYNGYVFNYPTKRTSTYRNNLPQGNKMSLDYYDYGFRTNREWLQKYYLYNNKPYAIKAQTMGDPSLEIGDTVSIQTRYRDTNDGYRDMVITKQQFTFNGGLQCNIDGIGS